ncbi:hypothetical protein AALA61_12050 [Oscillospiraceae bacterium 42-9]
MKKLKKLAAVVLAAAFAFASALPAGAVVVTDAPTPDRVFYRETAGETVFSELDAVYDPVDVVQLKGSMTLTVKNSRTLKPVANASYTLYKGTAAIKTGLTTDKAGQITVSGLLNYADEGYSAAHPEIILETENGAETYQVAAVVRAAGSYGPGEWSLFDQINISAGAFNTLVENLSERRLYDTGRGLVFGDRLLTLVTCEYSQNNGRLAVIAVKS